MRIGGSIPLPKIAIEKLPSCRGFWIECCCQGHHKMMPSGREASNQPNKEGICAVYTHPPFRSMETKTLHFVVEYLTRPTNLRSPDGGHGACEYCVVGQSDPTPRKHSIFSSGSQFNFA